MATKVSEIDANKLLLLLYQQVDQATCLECCKLYLVPTTAPCGHTKCHGCWWGRKKCATCGVDVERKSLKLNLHLQKFREHVSKLKEECEKIFKVKVDEFVLDTLSEKDCTKDKTKPVRDWLANSENQFSAPNSSQQSTHDLNMHQHVVTGEIQVHNGASKSNIKNNMIHVVIPQDNWDKIEEMPEPDKQGEKNNENSVRPMDIEPETVDNIEFTSENPRRSSRNINDSKNLNTETLNKTSSETVSKSLKSKVKMTKLKKMKTDFNKKKNKNNLNISIEMCKKNKTTASKDIPKIAINNSDGLVLHSDENTPKNESKECAKQNLSNKYLKDVSVISENKSHTQKNTYCQIIQGNKKAKENISLLRNNKSSCIGPVAFIMKGPLMSPSLNISYDNNIPDCTTVYTENVHSNNDDIQISIKIGNNLANICIEKKEKQVQLKVNTDREVQTSLNTQVNTKDASCSPIKEIESRNKGLANKINREHSISQHTNKKNTITQILSNSNSTSIKKNTDTADTATIQYEITGSLEKDLLKEMEKETRVNTPMILENKVINNENKLVSANDVMDEDCINDLDLFDNESIKEGYVQSLKSSKHAPSEILVSMKSTKSNKQNAKRKRNYDLSEDLPVAKKTNKNLSHRKREDIADTENTIKSKSFDHESVLTSSNYDGIMDQVFANIDADMDPEWKTSEVIKKNSQLSKNNTVKIITPVDSKATTNKCPSINGESENIFSLIEKGSNDIVQVLNTSKSFNHQPNEMAPANIEIRDKCKAVDGAEVIDLELGTPVQNNDRDDLSIVEETPEKSSSFLKLKRPTSTSNLRTENITTYKSLKQHRPDLVTNQNESATSPTPSVMNLTGITDDTRPTSGNSKQKTVLEAAKSGPALETPLTITKFVDQITHKSTPMARKSLNFDKDNTENLDMEPEQTLCPSSFLASKTTQEKEFMSKAFENSPIAGLRSPLSSRNLKLRTTKYCVVGTCLTTSQLANIKSLCSQRNWDYVDKYTSDVTHLVVSVDEEKRSKRSVKYMCALAASKWIVSYEWVEKCLSLKKAVHEEPFEALDTTGEPGPRRSRLARHKLFRGITFHCMPPFGVFDVETLQAILEAAGGRTVGEAGAARAAATPALLLAEPEHTQEDRFIYLAMEMSIVPVNVEWVFNCLGSYEITSVQDLLLCPASLLPPVTAQWPPELMAVEDD